jgi:hypothetical protein
LPRFNCKILHGVVEMNGPLYQFFAADHRRLEGLLDRATARPGEYEMEAYADFRKGLLRHIKIEEKILVPTAQKAGGGEPLPIAAKIRLDHGAITALLVPSPSRTVVAALRKILSDHNVLEESPGGLYETCEQLVGDEVESLLEQAKNAPAVPVNPYNDKSFVLEAARRAMARAGYDLDEFNTSDHR